MDDPLFSDELGKKGYWLPLEFFKEVGPFPSGNYIASLVANEFAPDPVSMPITIGDGAIPSVKFQMKPRESLVGYIVSSSKKNCQAGADYAIKSYFCF